MSTNGFEDCVAGTFYGLDTEYHPGDTINFQWGAISSQYNPLNITLSRYGGDLVDQIAVNARFSTTSSVFRLIVNETANCTMEQYSWAIPLDLDITNPKYLVGLFNASVDLGTYDIDLYGWEAWSPFFYVREESTSSSTATGISTTTLLSETGEPRPTPSATPPLTFSSTSSTSSTSSSTASPTGTSSDSDSTDVKIGVGVGVGVGGAIILALLLAWFFTHRRKKSTQGQVGPVMAMPPPAQTGPAELTGSGVAEAPTKPKRTVYEMQG